MTPPRGRTIEEVFWYHLPGDIGGEDCVEWPGCVGSSGYGKFTFMYRDYDAHRASYAIHKGEIPEGLMVLHDPVNCNNRRCVNPDHLRVGTNAENQRDRDIAGTDIRGDRVAGAKLKDADVIEIRRLRAEGVSENDLARQFGVNRTNINYIVNGRTWTHL